MITTDCTEQFLASVLIGVLRIIVVVAMWACLLRVTISRKGPFRTNNRLKRRLPPTFVRSTQRRRSISSVSISMSTDETSSSSDEDESKQDRDGHWHLRGHLTARVMPRDFREYQPGKPECKVKDVSELMRNRKQLHRYGYKKDTDSKARDDSYACKRIKAGQEDQKADPIVSINVTVDLDLEETEAKENRRAESSELTNMERTLANKGHLEIHLNRKGDEPADRMLHRLGISMERRLQNKGCDFALFCGRHLGRKEKRNIRLSSKVLAGACSSSIMVPLDSSLGIDGSGTDGDELSMTPVSKDGYRKLDISQMSSESLCRDVAAAGSDSIELLLTVPSLCCPVSLQISSCPPTVLSVKTYDKFESRLFVGVPIVISTEILHASKAEVSWFADGTEVCNDSHCFIPTEDIVGKKLAVLIIPTRPGHDGHGCEEAYEFRYPVEALPRMPLLSPIRDDWLNTSRERGENSIRVLTYNLLADLYTSREVDQKLMYNHCDPQFLHRSRRMPMLVYEILAHQADIICLQEVDSTIFYSFLEPVMASQGYQGYYSNKASAQLEGCAMFWSLDSFEYASQSDQASFSLRDLFMGTNEDDVDAKHRHGYSKWDSMDNIDNLLSKHDELRRVTREKVGQILQIATLTLRNSQYHKPEKIVVGNTHLFYHPMADHVRAMQAYVVCKQLDTVRRQFNDGNQQKQRSPYPIVLCGDMNATPLSGALQLLLQRRLSSDHFDTWKHLHDYKWYMGDYEFMVEHGYVGNDEVDAEDANFQPIYQQEAFQDAREYIDSDSDDEGGIGVFASSHENENELAISPPPLVLPTSFPNLISGYEEMPKFTNYAIDFEETLDYILVSEPDFERKRSAVMPTEQQIKEYAVAMPNEFMPSDHVSLVSDFEFKVPQGHNGTTALTSQSATSTTQERSYAQHE